MMRVSPVLIAIIMLGVAAPAAADPVRLWNCTGTAVNVQTYNTVDSHCHFARETRGIASCGGPVTFTCDGRCKVRINGNYVRGFGGDADFNQCDGADTISSDWVVTTQVANGQTTKLTDVTSLGYNFNDDAYYKQCVCERSDMNW